MSKPKLLILSHGKMAREALASAELIAGTIDNAATLDVLPDEGKEQIQTKIEDQLTKMQKDGSSVVVLVDLHGGTPGNIAALCCAKRENVGIIAGLNLAMIIAYSFAVSEDVNEIIAEMEEIGIEGIKKIDISLSQNSDSDDEIEID